MRRAAKVDTVAPALVQAIKDYPGARWLPWPGGPIDGWVLYRDRILAVDFKSKGGRLTDTQQRLQAQGWPLWILRSPEDVISMMGSR